MLPAVPGVGRALETPRPAAARAPWPLPRWAGVALAVALAGWLVAPVAGSRPPAGEDVMAHLVRADFGIGHLVAHGRLDGWFPRFALGHPQFLLNGPGLTWLVALVRAPTLGMLSNTGALKVIAVASFVAIPPAVWFLARSYGLSRRASELAAVASLFVSSPFGVGLEGLFVVGLIPHQLGAVWFCLALGASVRLLHDGRRRWVALAAGSLAALLVTHLISAVILALFMVLTLAALGAVRRVPAAGLARLAAAAAGTAGLAAFWLLPLLGHRDMRGVVTTWGSPPLPERLGRILSGELLVPAGFAVLVAAGWLIALGRIRRRPDALAWLAVPPVYLLVAHAALRTAPNDVTLQLPNRGLGYMGLLSALAVGALGAAAVRRFGEPGRLAALAAAGAMVVAAAPGRPAAGQMPEPVLPLQSAAAELARRVPDGARFATQRDYPGEIARTGVVHPDRWLARVSGRNTLNGFNLESSPAPDPSFEPERLGHRPPAESADRLARLGVTHVVTTSDDLADRLATSGRFVAVWQESPVAIMEVVPPAGQPSPATLVSSPVPVGARMVDPRPEHLAFALSAELHAEVTVAVAWSPKWRAAVNGEVVPLGRTPDGLATLPVPAGEHLLQLDYQAVDGWDRAGATLTAVTLLAAVAAWRRHRAFS